MVVTSYYYFQPTIPISITTTTTTTTTSSSVHRSPPTPPSLNSPNTAPVFGTTVSRIRGRPISVPVLARRPFLPSVSGIFDALTGGNDARQEALAAVRRGMMLFREISGRGGYHYIILIGLRKGRSNFGWMWHKIQMTLRSQYGAFFVKLNYTEWMKQGGGFLRSAEIRDLSCEKLITCSKMVVIQRSLLLHFQASRRVNTSTLRYMLASTMNHRAKQMQLKFTCLLPVSLHMVKGLVIIWLLLPRFTVYVEIGAPFDK